MLALLLAFRLWMPYRDFCEKLHLAPYARSAASEHDRFQVLLHLVAESDPKLPVTLLLRSKVSEVKIEPDAARATELPLRPDVWDENPDVLTSVAEGTKTKVTLDLSPRLPSGLSFSSSDMFKAVEQANRYIKQAAGFFSFVAPSMKGLRLKFARPATIRIGDRALRTDGHDSIDLLVADDTFEHAVTITLPESPVSADFID